MYVDGSHVQMNGQECCNCLTPTTPRPTTQKPTTPQYCIHNGERLPLDHTCDTTCPKGERYVGEGPRMHQGKCCGHCEPYCTEKNPKTGVEEKVDMPGDCDKHVCDAGYYLNKDHKAKKGEKCCE